MQLNPSLFSPMADLQPEDGAAPRLDFPVEKQAMSKLCWAAITASVCRYYNGPDTDQWRIVADVKDKPVCAFGRPIPFCNDTGDVGEALSSVGHLDQLFDVALTEDETIAYLQNGQLIGCQLFMPTLDGGHAVIIYGAYSDGAANLILRVADPADASLLLMPYAELLNNYRDEGGQWIRSYTTQ